VTHKHDENCINGCPLPEGNTPQRNDFERWARGRGINLTRRSGELARYAFPVADHAWSVWQLKDKEQDFLLEQNKALKELKASDFKRICELIAETEKLRAQLNIFLPLDETPPPPSFLHVYGDAKQVAAKLSPEEIALVTDRRFKNIRRLFRRERRKELAHG